MAQKYIIKEILKKVIWGKSEEEVRKKYEKAHPDFVLSPIDNLCETQIIYAGTNFYEISFKIQDGGNIYDKSLFFEVEDENLNIDNALHIVKLNYGIKEKDIESEECWWMPGMERAIIGSSISIKQRDAKRAKEYAVQDYYGFLDNFEEDELSEEQQQFVEKAKELGLDISYSYSGRGMDGATCPSVTVDCLSEFPEASEYWTDSMGLSIVVYCR